RGLEYLTKELRALGCQVPDSHANFVFADLGRPAAPVFEQLLRRGVITRPIPGYGFPNALRISVGLTSQCERLIAAMREIL
ncbi:MAG TPA: aminotransferase class I/II-fold pyridoxal phosphate-dependent enzyme, partial [Myxococcaceae bacterium]|nr:aminotransferase class I/II-fold pyridoxal phosphate-dependent enzyme [Myxococcaceae bacterium]